ncbi:response regulator transcription factor [Seonamhaeicola sp.]|uniref:response regulator n=1 Tax=Seonamhaeicola sp. TaxID=1912245 RepID=UPI002611D1C3|nr:response regulator transcription factor [Seonamhaeicola sp.]
MTKKATVLIVEDSIIFAEGLEKLLKHNALISRILISHNYDTAFNFIKKEKIDVVILDLNFHTSNYDGFTIAKRLRKDAPKIKIIVLTQYAKVDHYDNLINEFKVNGYLDKQLPAKHLFNAIDEVIKGNTYIDPSLKKMIKIGRLLKLSKREKQVVEELSKGLTQKEVASKLYIGQKTVESHVRNMCERLNAKNSAELIRIYINYKNAHKENYEFSIPPFKK